MKIVAQLLKPDRLGIRWSIIFGAIFFSALASADCCSAADPSGSCGEPLNFQLDSGCGSDDCGETLFGCISPLTSSKLLGDLGGLRPTMAESGISFDTTVAQFYMGVVSGGVDRGGRYSGHGDYVANIDGDKLFGMKGMFIKIRAEHRFGESMAGATGAFFPPNGA